jgi:hypothetical protein
MKRRVLLMKMEVTRRMKRSMTGPLKSSALHFRLFHLKLLPRRHIHQGMRKASPSPLTAPKPPTPSTASSAAAQPEQSTPTRLNPH